MYILYNVYIYIKDFMQYINWPQYVGLPQNKGLTTEQIRQRYMWYLNEQTILVESVANPTSTAAAAGGGGTEDITTNCYKYSYIETSTADFSDWTIDGYTIFTGEPGIYDLPPGLNAVETDLSKGLALYLWSVNNITEQSLTIYNPDAEETQSYLMKQAACETSTTATNIFRTVTSPSTTYFTTLDITDDSVIPITINLDMQSATFDMIGDVSKKLTDKVKQIFGNQADCIFEFRGSYSITFTNIYVGALTLTLNAEDDSGNEYQLNIT